MDLRKERVVVETDRYRVTGLMTLPAEGYRSRVSDQLNREDLRFLILEDAEVMPFSDGHNWTTTVLMLARDHVRLVMPADCPPQIVD